METMFFSFGHGQTCPVTGKNLLGHHARIDAPTAGLARAAMIQMFGQAWSFPYASFEALTGHGLFPSVEHVHIEIGGSGPAEPERDGMSDLYDCCPAAPTQPHTDDCPRGGA